MSSIAVAWTVRQLVVWLNVLAVVGVIAYAVHALRKTPNDEPSQNLTPFLADEELEGPRLERVLGWALFFAAIIAVALPVYWLREPTRQDKSTDVFDERAVERGEVLYSNKAMPKYDGAKSLQCADCHGTEGGGGAAPTVQLVAGEPTKVAWKAPAVNTVLYRFSPKEVHDILVYGRQGSPMQAWGLDGGGPKNEQSITDLVAYLTSIQISPAEAQLQAQEDLDAYLALPQTDAESLAAKVDEANKALDDARKALADVDPADEAAKYDAQVAVDEAQKEVELAQGRADRAAEYATRRVDVSAGQALFELNCARCHTENWSYWVTGGPGLALPEDVVGPPGGGGSLGFNLRGGQSMRRFPNNDNAFEATPAAAGSSDLKIWAKENQALVDAAAEDTAWTREDCEASPSGTFDAALGCLVPHGMTSGMTVYFDEGDQPAGFEPGRLYQVYVPITDSGDPDQYRFQIQPLSLWTVDASGATTMDSADSLPFPSAATLMLREESDQNGFITNGSEYQKPYGYKGIGSGRMPGQCNTALQTDKNVSLKHYGCELTQAMINAIVDYERTWIDQGDNTLAPVAAQPEAEVQP